MSEITIHMPWPGREKEALQRTSFRNLQAQMLKLDILIFETNYKLVAQLESVKSLYTPPIPPT